MKKKIRNDLEKIPLFKELTKEEMQFISPYLEEKKYKEGDVILAQGSKGGELYIIMEGSVSVDVVLPGNFKKRLTKLDKGQIFGEVSFFSNVLVTASVVADKGCVCVLFHHKTIEVLYYIKPEIAYKIEQEIIREIGKRLAFNLSNILVLLNKIPNKARLPFGHALYLENSSAKKYKLDHSKLRLAHLNQFNIFQRLTDEETNRLLSLMSVNLYEKGYRFFPDMKKSNKLSFIYSGAALFFIKEEKDLKKSISLLKIGDLLLLNLLQTEFQEMVDYVTCEDTVLLELDIDAYHKLHKSDPTIFYMINQLINQTVTGAVYIINRELVRLNSEYNNRLL